MTPGRPVGSTPFGADPTGCADYVAQANALLASPSVRPFGSSHQVVSYEVAS